MGFTVTVSSGTRGPWPGHTSEIRGPEPGHSGPEARFEDCVLGANCDVDLTWLREVPDLERVTFKGVGFHDVRYGREELWPMLAGQVRPVLKGCRLCGLLIAGDEGAPDVCPDGLAHRCVLFA
jgi:hypothetical protein